MALDFLGEAAQHVLAPAAAPLALRGAGEAADPPQVRKDRGYLRAGSPRSDPAAWTRAPQRPVKVVGGGDEAQVSEGLREIP